MEIISEDNAIAGWVKMLAEKIETRNDIGVERIAYRKNIPIERDCLLTLFIGCGGIGDTTNFSTSVNGIVRNAELSGKVVKMLHCNTDSCNRMTGFMPDYIVGRYSYHGDSMYVVTHGDHAIAICDIDAKHISIPDFSRDIGWSGNIDDDIDSVVSMVAFAADFIENGYLDMLLGDIRVASDSSVRVTHIETVAETSFDAESFTNECMSALQGYRDRVDNIYRTVFNNLRRDVVSAQDRGIDEAMELIDYMKGQGFVFVKPDLLKYTGGKITANTGIHNAAIYNTNVETWISGLRLTIRGGRVVEARCYRAYHPNCSGRHVCLGELVGTPMREAIKVVDALKVPNFSNGYWADSTKYLADKITDLEGSCDNVWSDDDE